MDNKITHTEANLDYFPNKRDGLEGFDNAVESETVVQSAADTLPGSVGTPRQLTVQPATYETQIITTNTGEIKQNNDYTEDNLNPHELHMLQDHHENEEPRPFSTDEIAKLNLTDNPGNSANERKHETTRTETALINGYDEILGSQHSLDSSSYSSQTSSSTSALSESSPRPAENNCSETLKTLLPHSHDSHSGDQKAQHVDSASSSMQPQKPQSTVTHEADGIEADASLHQKSVRSSISTGSYHSSSESNVDELESIGSVSGRQSMHLDTWSAFRQTSLKHSKVNSTITQNTDDNSYRLQEVNNNTPNKLPEQCLHKFVIDNPRLDKVKLTGKDHYTPNGVLRSGKSIEGTNRTAHKNSDQHLPEQKLHGFTIDNALLEETMRHQKLPKLDNDKKSAINKSDKWQNRLPLPSIGPRKISSKPISYPSLGQLNLGYTDSTGTEHESQIRHEYEGKDNKKNVESNDERKNNRKTVICIIILMIIVTLLIVGTCIAVYFAVRNNQNNGKDSEGMLCNDGTVIKDFQQCNGFEDCPDGADELYCDCGEYESLCETSGMCILSEWFCDGIDDCENGEDERLCGLSCSDNEFACRDHSQCITEAQHCDSTRDCSDGSDEWNCLLLRSNDQLRAYSLGSYLPVCASTWNDSLANMSCNMLGYGYSDAWSATQTIVNGPFVIAEEDTLESIRFRQVSSCLDQTVVELTCSYDQCGTVSSNIGTARHAKIIQGNNAEPSAWPWQVSLRHRGAFVCGGSLVDRQWVVTAAHCVNMDPLGPENFQVRLGTVYVSETDVNMVVSELSRIFVHPEYDRTTLENDIALIKLSTPITYSENIRPTCLPETQDANMTEVIECYSTGWGAYDEYARNYPERLQEARLNIIDEVTCAEDENISEFGLHEDVMLCAGYQHGHITVCSGDSGGPLACRDSRNVWTLVGVTSWGPYDDTVYCLGLSVFTRVSAFVNWIQDTLENNG